MLFFNFLNIFFSPLNIFKYCFEVFICQIKYLEVLRDHFYC